MEAMSWFLILEAMLSFPMMSKRTLSRFSKGHADNRLCWNRSHLADGFMSPIDSHNHFRPFGGPPVPWDTYMEWMTDHGIVFSTMFGIGQRLTYDPEMPKCCYYFQCPSKNYTVTPDPINDHLNAANYERWK